MTSQTFFLMRQECSQQYVYSSSDKIGLLSLHLADSVVGYSFLMIFSIKLVITVCLKMGSLDVLRYKGWGSIFHTVSNSWELVLTSWNFFQTQEKKSTFPLVFIVPEMSWKFSVQISCTFLVVAHTSYYVLLAYMLHFLQQYKLCILLIST